MRTLLSASLLSALLVALPAVPPAQAQADRPMTAEEFEAYVTGRTLTFNFEGMAYGVEQYLPGRQVIWAFIGDACSEGVWYPRADMICFLYENNPDEQCWHFFRTDDGLRGIFIGPDGPGTELYEVKNAPTPIACQAPGVGV